MAPQSSSVAETKIVCELCLTRTPAWTVEKEVSPFNRKLSACNSCFEKMFTSPDTSETAVEAWLKTVERRFELEIQNLRDAVFSPNATMNKAKRRIFAKLGELERMIEKQNVEFTNLCSYVAKSDAVKSKNGNSELIRELAEGILGDKFAKKSHKANAKKLLEAL